MNEVQDQFEYRHAKNLFADCDVDGLLEALKHPDVRRSRLLRGAVIEHLGDLADSEAIPDLVEILKEDPEKSPRMHAAIALGKIEDSRGIPALRLALRDPERPVRVWALDSIGRLRDRGSVETLIALLEDEDGWVREKAARALGQIGDHRASSALLEHLNDPKGSVRKAVASALVELGDSSSLRPLRDVYAQSGIFRRRAAGRALRELEERFG